MHPLLAASAAMKLELLPSNGLDRSLHLPVMVGLLIMAALTETLGWTYAGIVVPGYLAAVFAVAPITGVLIVGESVLAYLIAHVLGRVLPKTNAWSTLFGRERFLLIILVAVLVRLGVEASLLPWAVGRFGLSHSRELYSIGLVLVPLLANGFWNAGIIASAPRIALITGLTYLVVDHVLLAYTNFTVSRFQVANESVSLLFLDTPHAYIILVLGAVIGARENLRYGWDYNGILVPALLAVAWYQPTKLFNTFAEALLILFLTKLVTGYGPLSKMLIVGPRRLLVAYTVGFILKWVLGMLALSVGPTIQMVDYFGFGYLLPTLLAVKMWSADRIGSVLMPTLHVTVVSFLLGNGLALAMRFFSSGDLGADKRAFAAQTGQPIALDLMLADASPSPEPPSSFSVEPSPAQQTLRILRRLSRDDPDGPAIGGHWDVNISVRRRSSGWWTIVPKSQDPDDDRIGPRVAVSVPTRDAQPWLLVVQTTRVGDPLIVVAESIAKRIGARALVVRSRLPGVQAYDDAFVGQVRRSLDIEHVILLSEGGQSAALRVVGAVPTGLDVVGLGESLSTPIELDWRSPGASDDPYRTASELSLPEDAVQTAATVSWPQPEVELWPGPPAVALRSRLEGLTTVAPGSFRPPSIEELRLFGSSVLAPFLERAGDGAPPAWQRALAAQLGYRYANVGGGQAWALFEPPSERRRGHATWLQRSRGGQPLRETPLVIAVPAPRWERGAVDAGLGLYAAHDADGILLSGAFPTASAKRYADVRTEAGVRSYYHRTHELLIERGAHVVAVQGLAAEGGGRGDAIVTFEAQAADPMAGPEWTRPIVQNLQQMGLELAAVDGSLERVPFAGTSNPAMAYSRRFGGEQTMLLWLSDSVRSILVRGRTDRVTVARLGRAGYSIAPTDLATRVTELAACMRDEPAVGCPEDMGAASCDVAAVVERLVAYNKLRNPHVLSAALELGGRCHVEIGQDQEHQSIWALVAGQGVIELVPLRRANTLRRETVIDDLADVRGALALNLSVLRVELQP